MSEPERFLSEFTPLPEGMALPRRILADYQVESCLGHKEDGRLILRLRRKSDGKLVRGAARRRPASPWGKKCAPCWSCCTASSRR